MAIFDLIGSSARSRALFHDIKMVAQVDSAVLVQGETGAGKEVIANAIHEGSPRRQNCLAAPDCPAIPAALLESELFGPEGGAFKGAVNSAPSPTRYSFPCARSAQKGAAMVKRMLDSEPNERTNCRIAINPDAAASAHDDGIVILHTRRGGLFTSNRTGASIWHSIEQRLPCDEIARKLGEEYQIAQPMAAQHTARFLDELERHNLIERRAAA
jgi:hypothetical protein